MLERQTACLLYMNRDLLFSISDFNLNIAVNCEEKIVGKTRR